MYSRLIGKIIKPFENTFPQKESNDNSSKIIKPHHIIKNNESILKDKNSIYTFKEVSKITDVEEEDQNYNLKYEKNQNNLKEMKNYSEILIFKQMSNSPRKEKTMEKIEKYQNCMSETNKNGDIQIDGRTNEEGKKIQNRNKFSDVTKGERCDIETPSCINEITSNEDMEDIECLDVSAENGNDIFTWRIINFEEMKSDSEEERKLSFMSEPFYSDIPGYKMCLILFPFGDYISRGTYISVYFVIMKGDYDDMLEWPFKDIVTVTLLNQEGGKSISRSIKPPSKSIRFQKPIGQYNVKVGWMKYFSLESLFHNSKYYKDNILCINMTLNSL